MSLSQRRHALLRRLALLCTALVLAITTLSGFIRLSNAGLGCADWPQCYGSRLRAAPQPPGATAAAAADDGVGVALARTAHRVVAVLALLLVLTMVAVCFGNAPLLWREGLLALGLLALAVFLAVLGRSTAGARVPAVAIGNLLGGFAMLGLSWRLAAPPRAPDAPPHRTLAMAARVGAALLLVQLALGALVSASHAGLSCAGPAECWRAADAAGWPWQLLDPWREPRFEAGTTLPLNPGGAIAQVVHRGGALLVLAVLAPLGIAAWRDGRRRAGSALLALLLLQLGLGALTALLGLPMALALAHNVVAACLLATVLRLA